MQRVRPGWPTLALWGGLTVVLALAGCTGRSVVSRPSIREPDRAWLEAARIVARVQPPRFPDRTFSILDFGAVPDGRTDASQAIRQAVEACASAGGGRVLVPPGEYLTGPVHLRSRVHLHMAEGAVLKFKTDPNAYLR